MDAFRAFSPALLSNLAQNVVSSVLTTGSDGRMRLPQGLELLMQRTPDGCHRHRWRLALAREDRDPSPEEIDACREAFHIPPAAFDRHVVQWRVHPKSLRRIHYHVVELSWFDATQRNSAL